MDKGGGGGSSFAAYMRNLISVEQKLSYERTRFNRLRADRVSQSGGHSDQEDAAADQSSMRAIVKRLEKYDQQLREIQDEVDSRLSR